MPNVTVIIKGFVSTSIKNENFEYEYSAFFTKVFEYEYFLKCIRILMNTNTFCPGLLIGLLTAVRGQLAGGQLAGGQLAGGQLAGDFFGE